MEGSQNIQVQSPNTAQLTQIFANPIFPKYYSHDFIVGRTEGDIFVIHLNNGVAQCVTTHSFVAAKKLMKVLQQSIEQIESVLGEIKEMPSTPEPTTIKNQNKQ